MSCSSVYLCSVSSASFHLFYFLHGALQFVNSFKLSVEILAHLKC